MELRLIALTFIVGICTVSARPTGSRFGWNISNETCTSENCRLPDCFCSGVTAPTGMSTSEVPQMVMLTFDDAIAAQVWPYFGEILPSVKNPNGCSMSATFFVSHEYTNYYHVQLLRSQRHEIADHSITHRVPSTWWKNATKEEWSEEINGQRTILRLFGGVEDVEGFRAPFLQPGGDRQFEVLYEGKYLYDSSLTTLHFTNPPIWPFTLDYPSIMDCNIPPCPTKSYPGLWEVPLVDLEDKNGVYYSMVDEFSPATEDEAYEFLELNFNRHYTTNRAPFGVFMHAAWFQRFPYTIAAMKRFLAKLAGMQDVWLVSASQAIEWIRKPTPLSHIADFPAWQCNQPAPKVCAEHEAHQCYYPDMDGGKLCHVEQGLKTLNATQLPCSLGRSGVSHLMVTCAECPPHYPWYGNPTGK